MRRKSVVAALLCLATLAILALAVAPAQAVIGGQQDSGNKYANVGMNMEYEAWAEGQWGLAASCTLIRNEPATATEPCDVVVLLAAHQLAWASDPILNNRVTFESWPQTGWDLYWTGPTLPAALETYGVVGYVCGDFDADRPYWGSPMGHAMASLKGREDIALMWLDRPVTVPGSTTLVEPAPIAGLGVLDDVKGETFTVVGYGVSDILLGSFDSALAGGMAYSTWSGRNFTEARALTGGCALGDHYLKLSPSGSNWDSGGPLFREETVDGRCVNTIVALTSALESSRCSSPLYDYRLDTDYAQDFLTCWLENGPPQQ